jgi:hypothetical protein
VDPGSSGSPRAPDAEEVGATGRERLIPGDELASIVLRALHATADFGSLNNPALESAVRSFAAGAHAAGMPPERMLVALAAIISKGAPTRIGEWWYSVVRDRLVVWAIEGYYDIDMGRQAPPPGRSP